MDYPNICCQIPPSIPRRCPLPYNNNSPAFIKPTLITTRLDWVNYCLTNPTNIHIYNTVYFSKPFFPTSEI